MVINACHLQKRLDFSVRFSINEIVSQVYVGFQNQNKNFHEMKMYSHEIRTFKCGYL